MADYQQNFLASLGAGYNFGQQIKQQRDQSQLNQLASLAYGAAPEQRMELGSKIASLSPDAAQAQRKAWDANDERDQRELMGMARFIKAAPPEQQQNAYEKAIRPQLIARGMQAPNWTPETQGMIMQTVDALAQIGQDPTAAPSGFQAMDMQARAAGYAPGSKEYQDFFRRENGEIARASSAALKYEWVTGADGRPVLRALDPNSPTAYMATDAGTADGMPPIRPASGGGQQHFGDFTSLAGEFPGVTMTSGMRTAERNQQVGGTANSQHLTGTAADYAVPQQLKPAFISRARQMGYQAIDEGDHIHLQLPRGGRAGATGAPIVGRSKEDEAAATERAKLQAQLDFLPQQQAIETQGAIDRAVGTEQAKSEQERASNERAKTAQLNSVDRGLERIGEALGKLGGTLVDTGPIDGYLIAGTQAGQELNAAVGAIQNDMLALTRVPGIGSQSDLEAKIANLKYPSIYNHPSVNAANVEQLRAFMGDLRRQITGQSSSGNGETARPQTEADFNALPPGALYVDPDDGRTYRKR